MKSYLVRIAPLILEDWAAFLRHSAMSAGLSTGVVPDPNLALGCRVPGGCSGPALALRAGVNLALKATKKDTSLCAEVSDLVY